MITEDEIAEAEANLKAEEARIAAEKARVADMKAEKKRLEREAAYKAAREAEELRGVMAHRDQLKQALEQEQSRHRATTEALGRMQDRLDAAEAKSARLLETIRLVQIETLLQDIGRLRRR